MKRRGWVLPIIVFCLIIPSIASSDNQRSSAQAYLEELQAQGLQRVIVTFKYEINPALIEKYNGKLIRLLAIINGLVCEIPQENIELLRQEESIKNVVPDMVLELQGYEKEPDPEYLDNFLRIKKEYFKKIEKEYLFAKIEAMQEFNKTVESLETGYGYDEAYEQALTEYNRKLALAYEAYVYAASNWREGVNEMMALSYTGPVTVRWNNLEAGLNSKAAWDNYSLDGTGIKIAFLDTGINYTLDNLNNNYLGGYDFVNDDGDPMPVLDQTEDHGTMVASLAVGEGVNKVVGVAYNASYYSVRVLANDTDGGLVSDVISGIEWASTEPHKADIISMSLGTYGGSPFWEIIKAEFEAACNTAYNAGIILVAASGNDGYNYSWWPARFNNVISVGAHTIDQAVASYSNGEVDVVAPGGDLDIVPPQNSLYTVGADNSAWWADGTSFATPHVSALLTLQLQYARRDDRSATPAKFPFAVNNGCLWETMKHAAWPLTGEIYDPVYQGKGKIWASETNPPPPDPDLGSVDLMSSSIWPFDDFIFTYSNYIYLEQGLYPAYFIGTNMYQDITLTNNTATVGNTLENIENLNVTTTQAYYQHDGEVNMPGLPIEVFSPRTLNAGAFTIFSDTYYIPYSTIPGLDRTQLDINFNFVGNSRLLTISLPYASIWCPPAEINEGFPIEE